MSDAGLTPEAGCPYLHPRLHADPREARCDSHEREKMDIVNLISKRTSLAAACLLALGVSAHAQNGEYMINNNTAGDWTRWSYVDFATTTIAGHVDNSTATFGGVSGLKYKFLQLDNGN